MPAQQQCVSHQRVADVAVRAHAARPCVARRSPASFSLPFCCYVYQARLEHVKELSLETPRMSTRAHCQHAQQRAQRLSHAAELTSVTGTSASTHESVGSALLPLPREARAKAANLSKHSQLGVEQPRAAALRVSGARCGGRLPDRNEGVDTLGGRSRTLCGHLTAITIKSPILAFKTKKNLVFGSFKLRPRWIWGQML